MPIHLAGILQLAFLRAAEEGNPRETDARVNIGTVCIQSGHATNGATAPGVWIPKMWGWEGAIDGTHKSSDIFLKNDQNNRHDFHFGKRRLEIYF